MKSCISNIAWETSRDAEIAELLAMRGIQAVELAPTKYWPAPCNPAPQPLADLRARWENSGLRIVALQALLFGMPELNLLGDEAACDATIDYLAGIVDVGRQLGATRLVFGSPRNRDRTGLSDAEANARGIAAFRRLAEIAFRAGGAVAIEPNPPQYHCNFLNDAAAALKMVEAVDHPGLALHLDSGILWLNGEAIEATLDRAIPMLRHFHVSEPQLAPVGTGPVDHARIGRHLRKIGYQGYISVEMRPGATVAESRQNVLRACGVLEEHYCP